MVTPTEQFKIQHDRVRYLLLNDLGWGEPGAYVQVDGQFGSTGKGLGEQVLAFYFGDQFDVVTTNAGPNSGHTIYDWQTDAKLVTKQFPSFSVALADQPRQPKLYLNAGAIINPHVLAVEQEMFPAIRFSIHPHAAVVLPDYKDSKHAATLRIASTNQGTGQALAAKAMREKFGVVESIHDLRHYSQRPFRWTWDVERVFVSTAQGLSLGFNSGFYPYSTSRECTVQQALSDAYIPARRLRKCIATYRVHPIRVGNTPQGFSGGSYDDQQEISWGSLGVEPERTTVTNRVRRVFTWSSKQFIQGLEVNEPDALFINFLNYLPDAPAQADFIRGIYETFVKVRQKMPDFVLLGFGPRLTDVDFSFSLDDALGAIERRAEDRDRSS